MASLGGAAFAKAGHLSLSGVDEIVNGLGAPVSVALQVPCLQRCTRLDRQLFTSLSAN